MASKFLFLVFALCALAQFGIDEAEPEGVGPVVLAELSGSKATVWGFPTTTDEAVAKDSVDCPEPVVSVHAGSGKVYSFGRGENGELGVGLETQRSAEPVEVEFPSTGKRDSTFVVQLSAGYQHNLALTKDGRLFAWGDCSHGQCGLLQGNAQVPVQVDDPLPAGEKITSICAGGQHALLLSSSGDVYGTGSGNWGASGHDQHLRQFTKIEGLPMRVVSISCGGDHSLLLDAAGAVWAHGWNEHGQLGTGDTKNRYAPTRLDSLRGLEIVSIAGGGYAHSTFLTKEGEVLTCGWGEPGHLGHTEQGDVLLPTPIHGLPKIKAIASGSYKHNIFLTEDNRLIGFGQNVFLQLSNYEDLTPDTQTLASGVKSNTINFKPARNREIELAEPLVPFEDDFWTLEAASAKAKNRRQAMEDEINFFPVDSTQKQAAFAVFDGFGGKETSAYLQRYFPGALKTHLKKGHEGIDALDRTFQYLDSRMRLVYTGEWLQTGSTATAVLVQSVGSGQVRLASANLGDSRAIWVNNRAAHPLTRDHHPEEPTEQTRISAIPGAYVSASGRLMGVLQLSRCFGAFGFDTTLSREPFTFEQVVEPTDGDLLIVASDGLWGALSSHEILKIASGSGVSEAAEQLVKAALEKGTDNIAVTVARFRSKGLKEDL